MFGFRSRASLAPALGALVLAGALLLAADAQAAIFASAPADNAATLAFKNAAGTMTGRWVSRSIAISGDPKTALTKMSLGSSEFDLVEQGGKITGTRPAAKGKTYDVTGFVVYGARRAPQVVLHSTSDVNGKTFEYDYFGYLMPSWNVGAAQADTFMGTVVRTDPSTPDAAAIVVSFIATREAAPAAGAAEPAAKPAARPAAKPAAAAPADSTAQ